MKITCDVVKDLLPLYFDDVCSEDSKKLVDEHLANCENCRKELEYMSGEFSYSVNLEKEIIIKSSSKAVKRIKIEHFIIGLLIAALIAGAGMFMKYQKESQIGTTRALREERLQEANHVSVCIKDEYFMDETEDLLICTFDIYNGQESGIAFFEKQENGSYHFKASSWGGKRMIKLDTYDDYLVFYLDQPNIGHVELTFNPDGDESWTETHETTGLLWIKRPDTLLSYSIDIEYYDVDGNLYEQ